MPTLILKFNAPLQSWGTTLKLKNHYTHPYPSKSGVIGMIASAMGRKRDEDLTDLSDLRFGVRVDNPGTIIDDFQVSEVSSKEKKIGHRTYLSDACFICGIEAQEDILTGIKNALLHPANALFLGRRSCPVTIDLVQGIVNEELEKALNDYESNKERKMMIIYSQDSLGEAVRDQPISFSPFNRQYRYRFVETKFTK